MNAGPSTAVNKITGILMLLIYICVATSLLEPNFTDSYNMQNNVRRSALFGIIGIGVAFPIITGGIDLSIGSLIGLVGCLMPMLLIDWGFSVPVTLGAVLLLSLALGAVHGLLITKLRLQPFVVTLCGLLFYRGIARWITSDQTQGFGQEYNDSLRLLATGKPCSVAFLLLLVGTAIAVRYAIRLYSAADTSAKHEAGDRDPRLDLFGVLAGVALAVIGSARYWHGFEVVWGETLLAAGSWRMPAWSIQVPESAIERPGELMRWAGWLAVPALVWLLLAAFRGDARKVFGPLLGLAVSAAAVTGAYMLDEEIFLALSEDLRRGIKMAAIFLSLGAFMIAIGSFARASLKAGGRSSQLPLALAAVTGISALAGLTPLGSTLVPAPLITLALIASLAAIFLNQTIYGRYLLALGQNEEAARYSGIATDRMVILAYVICSGLAGVGGILFALDGNSIQPSGHGNFYELYAIAAAVLGGCSLRGGEGSILGVIIGAAVMRVLYNSISLLRIPPQLEFAIIGMVILIGVITDEILRRHAARRRQRE